MEMRQIQVFVTVAQMKSFSKAAEVLYISQPAVTNNVKKLETKLGVSLFHRHGRTIALTEAGERFYPFGVELINMYAKAELDLAGYTKEIQGHLELYASTIPEQYLLPYMVKLFKDTYPLVRITIRHQPSELVLDKVLTGLCNLGFVGAKGYSRDLRYFDIYEDRLVLIAPPHKAFARPSIGIADIVEEDIIFREEGSGAQRLFEKRLNESQLNMTVFRSQMVCESLEAIKNMVALGVGVSVVPYIAVKADIRSGRFKKYEIDGLDLKRSYSLVYCDNRCLSPLEEKFIDFVTCRTWTLDHEN